jgi:release factor glutamine methyltransferase
LNLDSRILTLELPVTVSESIEWATGTLGAAGVADARRDAVLLLQTVLGRDRAWLIAHSADEIGSDSFERFGSAVRRRAKREPLQYITGRQEFYGIDFAVRPGVLIPRPETELIVENAIGFLAPLTEPRFCEVGVGSGCISAAILKNVPHAKAVGLEISAAALAVAAENAGRIGVGDRFDLRQSDLFSALDEEKFDAIVSNPPYVAAAEISGLAPEVRDFEPSVALTDGADGLTVIAAIIESAPRHLRPGGLLLIECGAGQSRRIRELVDPAVWQETAFVCDLQGIERTLRLRISEFGLPIAEPRTQQTA